MTLLALALGAAVRGENLWRVRREITPPGMCATPLTPFLTHPLYLISFAKSLMAVSTRCAVVPDKKLFHALSWYGIAGSFAAY